MCAETNTGQKLCECGCGNITSIANKTQRSANRRKGEPVRFIVGHNIRLIDHPTGATAHVWKGGRIAQAGRAMVFVGRDHPMAYRNGYVFEHRLVMAGVIGRFLTPDEQVHHIDLDPTNNAPANLVMLTRSQHSRLHKLIRYKGASPLDALRRIVEDA